MVVASKLFAEIIQHCSCNDIVHTGGCLYNAAYNLPRTLLSNTKHFAPIVLLPLLLRVRQLDRHVIEDALRYGMETVLAGTAIGWSIKVIMCALRLMLGKFSYYSLTFVPTLVGALTTRFASARVVRLYYTCVFQCALESLVLRRQNCVTRTLADNSLVRTVLFMCCSASVLHAKREQLRCGFWLLQPNAKPQDYANRQTHNTCSHPAHSCAVYWMLGVRNYFTLGMALDVVRMLASAVPRSAPTLSRKLLLKLPNFRLRSTTLLVCYVSIYRFVHCQGNRIVGEDHVLHHLLAAFCGGACYMFCPELTLLCYALVLSIQTLWQIFESRTSAKVNNPCLKVLKSISYAHFLYPLALAYLVHTYCFQRQYVSSLSAAIINGTTDNYGRRLALNLQHMKEQFKV